MPSQYYPSGYEAESSPVGDSRVVAVRDGEVIVPEDLTDVELRTEGPELRPDQFGVLPTPLQSESDEPQIQTEFSEVQESGDEPIIGYGLGNTALKATEILGSERAGGIDVLSGDGEVAFIDDQQEFTADPIEKRKPDRDQILSDMKAEGWTVLADRLEKYGAGVVTPDDLSREGFRASVEPEAYAAYLFELMGLNGDLRVAYVDAISQEHNVKAFTKAFKLFLGNEPDGDVSELAIRARSIIENQAAYIHGVRRRRPDHIREEVRVRSAKHRGHVRVITDDLGTPMLVEEH